MKKIILFIVAIVLLTTSCTGGLDDVGGESQKTIELSTQLVNMGCEPDTYSVLVTSPYSWSATSDNSWIKIQTTTGIAGTQSLVFGVERNTKEEVRSGTIVLKNTSYNLVAELYITQKAFSPDITIEPKNLSFTADGGTQEVVISSNFDYEVSVNEKWLSVNKNSNGLTIAVTAYDALNDRNAEILISNQNYNIKNIIKVTQTAFVPEISIEHGVLNFPAEGGQQEVKIVANFDYEYSVDAWWCSTQQTVNGINIIVDPSDDPEMRSTTYYIRNRELNIEKTIIINQATTGPILMFNISSLEVGHEMTDFTISSLVTSNIDYEITFSDNWIFDYGYGRKYRVNENTAPKPRSMEITISNKTYGISKTLVVNQQANPIGTIVTHNGVKGMIFYKDENITKILSLTETKTKWSTELIRTSADSKDDGKYNMMKIMEITDWETKYPAFKICSDIGSGWYLPAEEEWQCVFVNIDLINAALSENGYDVIEMKEGYWSSTQANPYYDSALVFAGGGFHSDDKDAEFRVRAIYSF